MTYRDQTPRKSQISRSVGEVGLAEDERGNRWCAETSRCLILAHWRCETSVRDFPPTIRANVQGAEKTDEFESRSPLSLQIIVQKELFSWLPFLDTYRTMCLAPQPEFREALEHIRSMQLAT